MFKNLLIQLFSKQDLSNYFLIIVMHIHNTRMVIMHGIYKYEGYHILKMYFNVVNIFFIIQVVIVLGK